MVKEEDAIVLDYLPHGRAGSGPPYKREPVAQVIGKEYFTLLEVVPRKDVQLKVNEQVYIGDGIREKIHHIKRRIKYEDLTAASKAELEPIVKEIVESNLAKFVDFFNTAKALTTRLHRLELLPGVGKKHMWAILEERRKREFKDFEDLKERVKLLPNPKGMVIKRIMSELQGREKHYIFTAQPPIEGYKGYEYKARRR